ncbi:aspartyl-phosphate phosphatase Spo0E family protein [Ammoniphilus sp. YIM 78166]|uniref:aspartyl-phosphate phosphatase Spo0E family protein n=1 Tax=Ammoniphilus sp. YIM 78166 TaxID=1644106 RepID=UPI00142F8F9C|nr:aspartyl-phosphate phosphatase Spo0E family protein [Ammoniphilus sp. YIM 78166]
MESIKGELIQMLHLQMVKMKMEVEEMRNHLTYLVARHGFSSAEVLTASEKLDEKIVRLQKMLLAYPEYVDVLTRNSEAYSYTASNLA